MDSNICTLTNSKWALWLQQIRLSKDLCQHLQVYQTSVREQDQCLEIQERRALYILKRMEEVMVILVMKMTRSKNKSKRKKLKKTTKLRLKKSKQMNKESRCLEMYQSENIWLKWLETTFISNKWNKLIFWKKMMPMK